MAEATMLASVRDATWFNSPRHDGVGGHRVGAWSPKYHVIVNHPVKGESWSACGKAFLNGNGESAADIPEYMRCALNGCRQAFERADALGE